MEQSQVHKRIVKKIIREIYERKLKPGDKLPPLRELSKELQADQTSVRIALKHLEMMRLVDIKRSDGVYILDYLTNAGLEFIIALFPDPGEKNAVVDEYLIDEVFRYWTAFAPELIRMAWGRHSVHYIKELSEIYDRELQCVTDIPEIVSLEMRLMDILGGMADNIMVTLTMNTLRQVSERMTEIVMRSIGPDLLREYILMRQEILRNVLSGAIPDQDAYLKQYRQALEKHHQYMRKAMAENMTRGKNLAPSSSP